MIGNRTNESIAILDLHGPLIVGEDAAVRKAIRLAFDNGARTVILNLQDVPTIDSSGVAALASGHMTAANRSGQLKLCGMNQKLMDIFTIMRLHVIFDLYETEAAALASVTTLS